MPDHPTHAFAGWPSPRAVLFGAAPDTGNLGVSALCESLIGGLGPRTFGLDLTVFDHGRGVRDWAMPGNSGDISIRRCGAIASRRLHRPESYTRMWAAGCWGVGSNRGAELVRSADVVLDVSGGDSFADVYGPKRFRAITLPKRMALEMRRPLVLLPQTYGPFGSSEARALAAQIVQGAAYAWARDRRSFDVLRGLLGSRFDPARHRCTVDMAFGLVAREPDEPLEDPISGWLADTEYPVIGINVSGLIANRADAAAARFGMKADYREVISRLTSELLATTDARIVLVPHVHAPIGHPESDLEASLEIARRVPASCRGRIAVLPSGLSAGETKWLISRLDWVCATRMHACIAALSSGVPAAGVAYTDKARGVFETCDQGYSVIDPRRAGTEETIQMLLHSYRDRDSVRAALRPSLDRVLTENDLFFDALSMACVEAREQQPGGVAA